VRDAGGASEYGHFCGKRGLSAISCGHEGKAGPQNPASPQDRQISADAVRLKAPAKWLPANRASRLREHVVGLRADQPDGAHHDDKDHRQHDRVFRDVLTFIV